MAEDEIELKLDIAPEEEARFRRDPLIHRAKAGRAVSRPMMAVYFDTADLRLRAARTALRIRQEGAERIQTLKRGGSGAGLSRRREFNAPTDANDPRLELIDDDTMRAELEEICSGNALVPVFTTDVRRTVWMLDLPDGPVEMALDVGRIESEGRTRPVCEIELELKGGSARDLVAFAGDIAARYPVRLGLESKAQRGYALYRPDTPVPCKARKLELDPMAPAEESLRRIVEEAGEQMFANEAAVLDGRDPEGVHQMRVAVRRLRAALSAFRDVLPDDRRKPLNKALRRLQVALGPARDWDVFVEETLEPLQAQRDAPKALSRFAERVTEARRRAYKAARRALASARYGRLQITLVRFAYTPIDHPPAQRPTAAVAAELLRQRYETVLAAAGDDPSALEEAAKHALRIDIKKLRYALDFFQSLFDPAAVKPWRSAAKKLQDCLGALNDATVHAALVEAMDAPDRPVPKAVRKRIAAHGERKIAAEIADLDDRWERFRALSPFWDGPAVSPTDRAAG
jgi:inorganic triphosphatase YgiF